MVFKQGDVGRLLHPLNQRGLHCGAGGVGHVHDAPRAVAAFAREVQVTVVLGAEGHAHGLQPGNRLRRLLHHKLGGRHVAQSRACDQGVVHMRGKAVGLVPHSGNATLGPATGAFAHRAFGDDGNPVFFRQQERRAQAGQAAADDQDVKLQRLRRRVVVHVISLCACQASRQARDGGCRCRAALFHQRGWRPAPCPQKYRTSFCAAPDWPPAR